MLGSPKRGPPDAPGQTPAGPRCCHQVQPHRRGDRARQAVGGAHPRQDRAVRPDDASSARRAATAAGGRVRWIVDPIDGTVNFLYGLPDWAVSIAVELKAIRN